jgi:hypothetical protein
MRNDDDDFVDLGKSNQRLPRNPGIRINAVQARNSVGSFEPRSNKKMEKMTKDMEGYDKIG